MAKEKEKLEKKDFIEIEFTGRVQNGEIFDSNVEKDVKKAKLKTKPEPFIFSLGQGMFLKGVDDFLIGKEPGKTYEIKLDAKDAFGTRNPKLIKVVPLSTFKNHNVKPFPGAVFNFDGKPAKILSVSGGRVRVDFNNLLAGKDVEYNVNVLRKVTDIKEKAESLIKFLFRKDMDFKINEKDKKIIIKANPHFSKILKMFKDKFKEILDLDLEVDEIKEKSKSGAEKDTKEKQDKDKNENSEKGK